MVCSGTGGTGDALHAGRTVHGQGIESGQGIVQIVIPIQWNLCYLTLFGKSQLGWIIDRSNNRKPKITGWSVMHLRVWVWGRIIEKSDNRGSDNGGSTIFAEREIY